jgi:hypothetical protein
MPYKAVLLILFMICVPLHDANAWSWGGGTKTTALKSHQPIKAEVIDSDPAHFTIDVGKLANKDADDNAKTFALYTSDDPPKTCGDFSELDLKYEKPEKHKRIFDLSGHKDVLKALKKYQCVVVKNKS